MCVNKIIENKNLWGQVEKGWNAVWWPFCTKMKITNVCNICSCPIKRHHQHSTKSVVDDSSSVSGNVRPVRKGNIGEADYVKDFISLKYKMYYFELKLTLCCFIKNNRAPATRLLWKVWLCGHPMVDDWKMTIACSAWQKERLCHKYEIPPWKWHTIHYSEFKNKGHSIITVTFV